MRAFHFETIEEAEAFKHGIEYVNDSSLICKLIKGIKFENGNTTYSKLDNSTKYSGYAVIVVDETTEDIIDIIDRSNFIHDLLNAFPGLITDQEVEAENLVDWLTLYLNPSKT